jgi:hypothetical protein
MGLFTKSRKTRRQAPPRPGGRSRLNRAALRSPASRRPVPSRCRPPRAQHGAAGPRRPSGRFSSAAQGPHPPAAGRAAGRAEPAHAAAGHRSRRSARRHPRSVPERKRACSTAPTRNAHGRGDGRDLRPGPAGNAAEGSDHQRYPGQPLRPHLRRAPGRLELADTRFRDNQHLRQIIDRIVGLVGRRVDETSPMVDARLADGSRVNAIIPPLALDGPAMSIRRFGSKPMQLEDLIRHGAFPAGGDGFPLRRRAGALQRADQRRHRFGQNDAAELSVALHPADERVITIEDAAELQLQQPHVVRLETRPMNIEGKGEVTSATW